jgi:release factor glutamine methyltransferase
MDGTGHPQGSDVLARTAAELAAAGVVAAEEEATELVVAAAGAGDLPRLVERRRRGEPLAWLTGRTRFCGTDLVCHPGVYVPRWQSEPLARRAARLLHPRGTAVDVATGAGAVAAVLARRRPGARVLATEIDHAAAANAAANGVRVVVGDMVTPLGAALDGAVDVLTAILPYVPTPALRLLPRDDLAWEPERAYDGGPDGCDLVRRLLPGAARLLRPGGTLLVEIGADQPEAVAGDLDRHHLEPRGVLRDADGDVRGLEARRR